MNPYVLDLSLLDFGYSDQVIESLISQLPASPSNTTPSVSSPKHDPPRHRHDGTSPLPLGMDWSPPPRKWDGRHTVWPHNPHTGWSYCVTIPSWTIPSNSSGSGPVVLYRVQVGIQTPEAITTTREILRRFSDFLKLYSELKMSFPKKILPVPPPRRLLGTKSNSSIEERRCALEDWMEKLLSNIDISRGAPVAIFLELEAAARSSFNDLSGNGVSSLPEYQTSSDISVTADASSVASDYGDETGYEKSEIGTPSELNRKHSISEGDDYMGSSQVMRLSTESAQSEENLLKTSEISNSGTSYDESGPNFSEQTEDQIIEDIQFPSNLVVALPSDQRPKFSRVLIAMQRRLATGKADMEDLVARLNQELAVRQYLTTKVKDLEVELETTKENTKDNLQQAVSIEKERFTQMQWDVEEFRKKCMEMELKLKEEQDEKARLESENMAVIEKNELLMKDLEVAREQLEKLQRHHEEFEQKSKLDVKVLVKEVKSVRSSQSELKQELDKVVKEKLEVEGALQNEKHIREHANSVNEKLLHECSILQKRLQECSVSFVVEEEDNLVINASSPSDAIDLLTTSDNRIGLLLAEAQLLAQDVENSVATSDGMREEELRKMLTEIFIDNATLRKQINSVLRCTLNKPDKPKRGGDEEEEAPSRNTVLSKFL